MNMNTNPPISRLLRGVTALEVLVLVVAGGGLLVFPAQLTAIWPWELAPFNARFLGAVYFASMVAAAIMVYSGRWNPARIVVPMILIFTTIVLIVSLLNLDRFDLASFSTVIWFILYIGIPLNGALHLWLYRRQVPPEPITLAPLLRTLLLIEVALMGVYGVLQLIAPVTFSGFWPWPLDAFHGRVYSVAFITPATGAWLLLRSASTMELRTLGVTQIAGGGLSLIGLVVVDMAVHRVDWTAAGTWVWCGLFAFLLVLGVVMLIAGGSTDKDEA